MPLFAVQHLFKGRCLAFFYCLFFIPVFFMLLTEQDTFNLQRKAERYKEVLQNTQRYRKAWRTSLKTDIQAQLKDLIAVCGIPATLEERKEVENLEAVVLTLGNVESGLGEPVGGGLHRQLIKQNGSLVYQQLFNGKILVLINYPYIEKYGQPQPPKTIAIYRPEELKEPYFLRHLETFLTEITSWEDYDDDLPENNQRIGFKLNFQDKENKNAG